MPHPAPKGREPSGGDRQYPKPEPRLADHCHHKSIQDPYLLFVVTRCTLVCDFMLYSLFLQQLQKFFPAYADIVHNLHQYAATEFLSRMHGDYCAPAIRMFHDEMAALLSYRLKAYLGKSLDHSFSFNRFQLQQLALQQSFPLGCSLQSPSRAK